MSIGDGSMAGRSISEAGSAVRRVRRPPPKRQAVAVADATMRPEPR
jgi:hypothetical protein